ncbi:MAG TPA: 16S rRNA processing protein RimM [Firmicutes bacterium]|nr:16S rRNA processing protein RimM [Bacillota bacterium]
MKLSDEEVFVSLGKVTSPHGVKGIVKVFPYFDFPERMASLNKVVIEGKEYFLKNRSRLKQFWLLELEGVNSREDAEKLAGKEITVPKTQRFPLPQDAYYIDDIIGMNVYEESGRMLGKIEAIKKTRANDIYIIKTVDEDLPGELYFPALRQFVKHISLEEKKMVVIMPEGLENI